MLHVILLILKIIGLILAALLGLALLILFLVLFVPVRYRIFVLKKDELLAKGKMSWLLHLISFQAAYQNGEFSMKLKLLGFITLDLLKDEESKPEKAKPKKEKKKKRRQEKEEIEEQQEETEEQETVCATSPVKTTSIRTDSTVPTPSAEKQGFFHAFWRKLRRFWHMLLGLQKKIRNLKYTFQSFCGKIKKILQNLQNAKEFLTDERTTGAIGLVWGQIGYLMKHILPRKLKGEVHFGTEDPALTGEILGGLGIFYPLFMDNVKVYPHFEESCLEGELYAKGHLHMVTAVRIVWKLWRDKNIRFIYNKFME